MSIGFYSEIVKKPNLNFKLVKLFLIEVVKSNFFNVGELNFIFCSNEYIKDINTKYLNHNYYTDVITFDYCHNKIISGDIFISVECVFENSVYYNVSYENELLRNVFHGVLHLLKYDDKSNEDSIIMKEKEQEYLNLFKFKSDEFFK